MSETAAVGRPKGKAKKTSDATRIRKVLNQYGVTFPTKKVKRVLAGRNRVSAQPINLEGNAINVKIAQVRSTMVKEQTGVERQDRGRYTTTEMELIEARLEANKTAEKAAA